MNPNQPSQNDSLIETSNDSLHTEQVPTTAQTNQPGFRSAQQTQPTESGIKRAFNWYTSHFNMSARLRKSLLTFTPTNSYIATARTILSIISVITIVLVVIPIIITIVQAQGADDKGPAGMVVFAVLFLAPFWALCVAAWFAVVPLTLCIIGAAKAQWKLQRKEYLLLMISAIFVMFALITIRQIPAIMNFYQMWFLPWLN